MHLPYFHRRRLGPRMAGGFLPNQVPALYGLPAGLAGKSLPADQPIIAILELGGGYHESDVAQAFDAMNIPGLKPIISNASVMSGKNSPGDDADGEVALDIQVAAGVYSYLTGRAAHVLMLWSPNRDDGFAQTFDAASAAKAAAMSCSWGSAERNWTQSGIQAMNAAIRSCVESGCACFSASGDNDSGDGLSGNNADYPASDPFAVGCGGTNLTVVNGMPVEKVWNNGRSGGGTGGGYSKIFPTPDYQRMANQSQWRGVPDVAGVADPETGWRIVLEGQVGIIGGTSAVAPMWAGITAAAVALGATPGAIFARLYQAKQGAFRDVLQGNNGGFAAQAGWDPCTGLGTPGTGLMDTLRGVAAVSPPPVQPPPIQSPPIQSPPIQPPPISVSLDHVILAANAALATALQQTAQSLPFWAPPAVVLRRAHGLCQSQIDDAIEAQFAAGGN